MLRALFFFPAILSSVAVAFVWKFALEGSGLLAEPRTAIVWLAMVQIWAAENMTTRLRVNLLSPGPIRTRMRAQAMPGEDPSTLEAPDKVAEHIVTMCEPSFTETGKVYVWSEKRLLAFRSPD